MNTASFIPIEAKSGLSRATLPDTFFTAFYHALAPYRGCAHGCRYCDGRAERYYVEGDFETAIAARVNLPEVVARDVELGLTAREYGSIGLGSGVTDVYQPLERDLSLTRRTLEALIPTNLPIVILTKNDLILRDFDILARFPRALVIVTVTTTDPEKAQILEPGASPPEARLEVVRRAKEAGFFAGVMAMPFCPGITLAGEETQKVFEASIGAGADFIQPGGLTLRPGRQKDFFISEVVAKHYPELAPLYAELYGENRKSGIPLAGPSTWYGAEFDAALRSLDIPQMIPHSIFREILSPCDSLFTLFCHMQSLYSARGVDTRPLRSATDRYVAWLLEERATLRRKRVKIAPSDPFPITRVLGEMLADLAASGGAKLEKLIGNDKLARLVAELIEQNLVFDYPTLTTGTKR